MTNKKKISTCSYKISPMTCICTYLTSFPSSDNGKIRVPLPVDKPRLCVWDSVLVTYSGVFTPATGPFSPASFSFSKWTIFISIKTSIISSLLRKKLSLLHIPFQPHYNFLSLFMTKFFKWVVHPHTVHLSFYSLLNPREASENWLVLPSKDIQIPIIHTFTYFQRAVVSPELVLQHWLSDFLHCPHSLSDAFKTEVS